jgi:excisionase family DNA binding protein
VPQELYSVDQVADLLGLHVKTVRNYVREGRLKAVRIGKQYRISRDDLETFTGATVAGTVRESTARRRHAEVSSIVQIDAVSPTLMYRLSTLLTAAAGSRPDDDQPLRVETAYDERRGSLKIIVIGGLASTAELLRLADALATEES